MPVTVRTDAEREAEAQAHEAAHQRAAEHEKKQRRYAGRGSRRVPPGKGFEDASP